MVKALTWPAWFTGPEGQSAVFESADDVPKGWTSGAECQTADGKTSPKPAAPAGQADKTPKPAKAGPTPTPTPTPTPAPADADLDADGHPYSETLHAATKSKTKDGKWRMKVGVKRPDPAPGYPKPAAPLDL